MRKEFRSRQIENYQQGTSLTELLLIIGVIAIASGGIFGAYAHLSGKRKIEDAVRHSNQIAENLSSAFITGGDYAIAGLTQENAKQASIFPIDMLDGQGNPKSRWGGRVSISRVSIGTLTDMGAAIEFDGVPAGSCSDFISRAAPGFYSASVNGHMLFEAFASYDTARLVDLCNSAATARVQFVHARNGGALKAKPHVPH